MKRAFINLVISLFAFFFPAVSFAAGEKKPLDEKAYSTWYYLSGETISPDGEWVSYEQRNMAGERFLILYGAGQRDTLQKGRGPAFSPDSRYLLYKINNKKAKPEDTFYLRNLSEHGTVTFAGASLVNFLPALQTVLQIKRPKDEKGKGYDLTLYFPEKGDSLRLEGIRDHKYSEDFNRMIYAGAGDSTGCWKLLNLSRQGAGKPKQTSGNLKEVSGKPGPLPDTPAGIFRALPLPAATVVSLSAFSADSSKLALLYRDGKKEKIVVLQLPSLKNICTLADSCGIVPPAYGMSGGKLEFSPCGTYLYFKVKDAAPVAADTVKHPVKDLCEIWKWDADFIPPMKKGEGVEINSHFASYHLKKKRFTLLSSAEVPFLQFPQGEHTDLTLAFSNLPYLHLEGIEPSVPYDIYLVDMITGANRKVLERKYYYPTISADKKYMVWFEPEQKAWFSMNTETLEKRNVTEQVADIFHHDELDMPMHATHFGNLGWSEKGHRVYLNSKYDVWSVDAAGVEPPVCLTLGKGKQEQIRFRYIKSSESQRYYREEELDYFTAFSPITKQAGYYKRESGGFFPLVYTAHAYPKIHFSKDKKRCVFRRQSFTEYPDFYYAATDFKEVVRVSNGAPQQSEYNWGTSRLVEWLDFDRKPQRGILCLPEDFDSTRTYPMIVYFYEKKSDELHKYHIPAPIGTVVNWSFCTSNGYIVFIPDITFTPGEPGESSYNAVVSGVKYLADVCPFVDREHIGLNGHSWGGYQSAYLITRTNLFQAAVSGAPVVNMVSGYGGIRWGTGKSRMFQYEQSQSRIGATLWEAPELYVRNSPLFQAHRIETPVLILHNDKDGSVMWEQGIEFFMAMRRLGKPAWLLNYKGADHKLSDWKQRLDYSRKVMEYYGFYLKGEKQPLWMK